jgi:hypothetical protein
MELEDGALKMALGSAKKVLKTGVPKRRGKKQPELLPEGSPPAIKFFFPI